MLKFGQWIREARMSRGLSLSELASQIGMGSPQALGNVERGAAPFPARYARRFCRACGLELEEFTDRLGQTLIEKLKRRIGHPRAFKGMSKKAKRS